MAITLSSIGLCILLAASCNSGHAAILHIDLPVSMPSWREADRTDPSEDVTDVQSVHVHGMSL